MCKCHLDQSLRSVVQKVELARQLFYKETQKKLDLKFNVKIGENFTIWEGVTAVNKIVKVEISPNTWEFKEFYKYLGV